MKKKTLIIRTAADLKKARQQAGYTMQSLADKLHVSRIMVTRWESGNENLSLKTIEKICDAMGVNAKIVFKNKS